MSLAALGGDFLAWSEFLPTKWSAGLLFPSVCFARGSLGMPSKASLSTRLRALRNFVMVATGRPGSLPHVAFYACGVKTLTLRVDVKIIH
jgi:hypothetical protein